MEIKVKGELSFVQILQALYEQFCEIEDETAIKHSRGATLYLNPTDGEGEPMQPRSKDGRSVHRLSSKGPYRSAAEDFKI